MTSSPLFAKAVGRRKTAIANLSLIPGSGKIYVNNYLAKDFFSSHLSRYLVIYKPFIISTHIDFDAKVKVRGGGLPKQSEAVQLSLARALLTAQPKNQRVFRENYLLTRDSREKERRKYGLKKARKAPQFSKR